MATDIQALKTDIQSYLDESNFGVFRGVLAMQETPSVYWDTEREPDFRKFLRAAEQAGVHMVIFDFDEFTQDEIDDAFDLLEDAGFTRDERRGFETRMRELQKYEGFTSRVELMFGLEGRMYTYRMQAEWYSDWRDLVNELELLADPQVEGGQDPLPGYFSTN